MGEAVGDSDIPTATMGEECHEEAMEISPDLPRGFWRLPPEIRNKIYEELLVTNCAFRLGHHGPYSHESRKALYPQILRTSSQAHHEAISILYGSNTFFLGPVGFKPTYSASFLTSIGPHNALRIRTIVAHCIHPHVLTRNYLDRWFGNLGLDTGRLKIVAVSFGSENGKDGRGVPSLPPPMHMLMGTGMMGLGVPVLGSQWPTATIVSGNAPPASTPTSLTTTVVVPTTPSHVRVDSMRDDTPESEFESAAGRNKRWLEKRKRSDVESLVALRNTDLRAGDDWLVYISPAVKKRMGTKIW